MYTPIIYIEGYFYVVGGYIDENFDNTSVIGRLDPSSRVS